jgi:3-deoxy-manno-octulosonate cytidylyltransferase (CMP-KDO synthetase)
MNSRVIAVIPARFDSTRFPGKPLAYIKNKPMIQWVVEGIQSSKLVNDVILATDHQEIFNLGATCGVLSVMTPSDLASGTDRIYAAVKSRAQGDDIILNVQGDEPLIKGHVLDLLISKMRSQPQAPMGTLVSSIQHQDELLNPNCVKVLVNNREEAIYFSRFPVPYSRSQVQGIQNFVSKKHIGIYAYRYGFLKQFCETGPSLIELGESLEQLRALQMGASILAIHTDFYSHGVDVPSDIALVEKLLN